jgi:hypothetical protein
MDRRTQPILDLGEKRSREYPLNPAAIDGQNAPHPPLLHNRP